MILKFPFLNYRCLCSLCLHYSVLLLLVVFVRLSDRGLLAEISDFYLAATLLFLFLIIKGSPCEPRLVLALADSQFQRFANLSAFVGLSEPIVGRSTK